MIKLITQDSIDEDMLSIGVTKLQLDDAVGGDEAALDGEGNKEDNTAKEMRKSLLTTLRNKFDAGAGGESLANGKEEDRASEEEEEKSQVKKARGSVATREKGSQSGERGPQKRGQWTSGGGHRGENRGGWGRSTVRGE